jgi:hypothetical protein
MRDLKFLLHWCTFLGVNKFEDTKGGIKSRKSKDKQNNDPAKKGQKNKQLSTKHYTEH